MRTALLAAVLAALAVAASPARADDWSKQYTFSGKPDLRFHADEGRISIEPGDSGKLSARVSTIGWRISPGEVRVEESQSGNRIQIDVRVPHGHWGNWFGTNRRSVEVTLQVPRESDLDVDTGDGRVSVSSVSGNLRFSTGDGHITADDLRGQVRLHTGDGYIEGSGFDGSLEADTGDGHITVRGRFDLLSLRTGDGSIDAAASAGSKMRSDWTLHTGDGRITLSAPEGFAADLDAHTGDGSVNLDFPVTVSGKLERSHIRGQMNGGGNLLRLESGDGSIELRKM